jgi:hypothetical protein
MPSTGVSGVGPEIQAVTSLRREIAAIPGIERYVAVGARDSTSYLGCPLIRSAMVDPALDDEDRVDDEVALFTARAEQDDGSAVEIAELGCAALGVLETAGVLELVAEDERVGVLPPRALPARWRGVVRLVQQSGPIGHRIWVRLDDAGLRLPFAPEDELIRPQGTGLQVAAGNRQELPLVLAGVPVLEAVAVRPVLAAGMHELDKQPPITHVAKCRSTRRS